MKWQSSFLGGKSDQRNTNRTDNQIKNFFYGAMRREIRKLNISFKEQTKYKSKYAHGISIEIVINQSTLLKIMKRMNLSLTELVALPILELGDYLMNNRRKKRPSKTKQEKEHIIEEKSCNQGENNQKIENLHKDDDHFTLSQKNNTQSIEKMNEIVESPQKTINLPFFASSSGKFSQSPGK